MKNNLLQIVCDPNNIFNSDNTDKLIYQGVFHVFTDKKEKMVLRIQLNEKEEFEIGKEYEFIIPNK